MFGNANLTKVVKNSEGTIMPEGLSKVKRCGVRCDDSVVVAVVSISAMSHITNDHLDSTPLDFAKHHCPQRQPARDNIFFSQLLNNL